MLRNILAPALVAVLMTTTAPANAAQVMVKDVAVTVDLAAITNKDAAKYWANLGDDLKAAIAARIADRISPDGAHLLIKVSSLGLSTGYMDAAGVVAPHLVGVVNVVADTAQTGQSNTTKPMALPNSNYTLTISATEAEPFVPAGTDIMTISPDKKEYHDALIAAFADYVAKHL
ncbi:hypothetical protein GALL_507570 [mine drainage metagenome]|uniref:Uncharacterized protein n=1 Tax=mine drainage metagenome TaxID=410659 RepID=A0A1J5P8T5_9ZZZZ